MNQRLSMHTLRVVVLSLPLTVVLACSKEAPAPATPAATPPATPVTTPPATPPTGDAAAVIQPEQADAVASALEKEIEDDLAGEDP